MKTSTHVLAYVGKTKVLILTPSGVRPDEFYVMAECSSIARARVVLAGLNKVDVPVDETAVPA